MAGELELVAVAPLVERAEVVLLPEVVEGLPVVEPDLAKLAGVPVEGRQMIRQIVAAALPKFGQGVVAEGQGELGLVVGAAGGDQRLVIKDPADGLAELRAQVL